VVQPPLGRAARDANEFPTILDSMARRSQITFDGLLITSNIDLPPTPQRAYTQVLRTGAVEAIASSLARGRNHDSIILPQIDAIVIRYSGVYVQALHALGVEPPFAILASLIDVKGMKVLEEFVPAGALWEDMPSTILTQEQYHFVETIFDSIPVDDGRPR
jgi:hypothetical protein